MNINIDEEDGIELLYFIFERELKPPFKRGDEVYPKNYAYFNNSNIFIGYFNYETNNFVFSNSDCLDEVKNKVCKVFGLNPNSRFSWWWPLKQHMKTWLQHKLNVNINYVN